eukprot:CAMPEP_0204355084 /NCGR_PEP_ID=MMETSP0469-20131031/33880_1 /ASSEMBLY_ACC=CAM_ASM_000384 /TAXON_ID=2969 /ORGANISM="Oxyrrhis marina" /LENGTH=77 /DNA_ID=CAMNT_0051342273 /DNA_START=120 /DNA_END=350 /DNA_ORIENTATION=+
MTPAPNIEANLIWRSTTTVHPSLVKVADRPVSAPSKKPMSPWPSGDRGKRWGRLWTIAFSEATSSLTTSQGRPLSCR